MSLRRAQRVLELKQWKRASECLAASTSELLGIPHIGCRGTTPVLTESIADEFVETKKCLLVEEQPGVGEWKEHLKKATKL